MRSTTKSHHCSLLPLLWQVSLKTFNIPSAQLVSKVSTPTFFLKLLFPSAVPPMVGADVKPIVTPCRIEKTRLIKLFCDSKTGKIRPMARFQQMAPPPAPLPSPTRNGEGCRLVLLPPKLSSMIYNSAKCQLAKCSIHFCFIKIDRCCSETSIWFCYNALIA
jgi:hypothetical protein